jgi:hypothetical protein
MLLAALVVACCGDLNAQGVVKTAPQQQPKIPKERAFFASLEPWADVQVTVLVPASAGSPSRRVLTDAKTLYYSSPNVGIPLALISDRNTSYVVCGSQSFFVFRDGDVLGALVEPAGLTVRNSCYRLPRQTGNDGAVIASFMATFDDAQMLALYRKSTRIDLTPGIPIPFWTAHGGLDSQPGQPEIVEMDLMGNNLRLLLAGAGGKLRATFWIDIARRVLTRTEMDGKIVFSEK